LIIGLAALAAGFGLAYVAMRPAKTEKEIREELRARANPIKNMTYDQRDDILYDRKKVKSYNDIDRMLRTGKITKDDHNYMIRHFVP
jgi:hypothetical protein